MKNIISALLLLTLFSCKKDSVVSDFRQELAGSWELQQRTIGLGGTEVFPAGNGEILVFEEDGTYQRKSNSSPTQEGEYTLGRKKDCQDRASDITLKLDEVSSDLPQYVSIENDKLISSTSNCYADGGNFVYRRLP